MDNLVYVGKRNNIILWPSRYLPALGGVESVTEDIALELNRRGLLVQVWTHCHNPELAKLETINRIVIRRFKLPMPSRNIVQILKFIPASTIELFLMMRLLRQFKPCLIHLHGLSANGLYAYILSKVFGVPLYLTLHGETHSDTNDIFIKSKFMRLVLKKVLSSAKKISSPSRYTLEHSSLKNRDLSKAKVIPNPICLTPQIESRTLAFPFILFAGRLELNKGVDVLIDSFAELNKMYPIIHLVLLGEGSKKNDFILRTKKLGLERKVHFLGQKTRKEVHELMIAAEMTCLFSEKESFGLVALESFYLGTPVIATCHGGLKEYLPNTSSSLLVDPKDSRKILSSMENIFLITNGEIPKKAPPQNGDNLPHNLKITNVVSKYLEWYGDSGT